MHLDACFLIDLQRERVGGKQGEAHRFLAAHPDEPMAVSVVAAMEYLEGFDDAALWSSQRFLNAFEYVTVDLPIATRASRIRRNLRRDGELLADADILIAACALEAGQPLVTNNARHFERVEGLRVLSYR